MAEVITWDEYIKLAGRYLRTGMLDNVELGPKRAIETQLKRDRERALAQRRPVAITAEKRYLNWLDHWRNADRLSKWIGTAEGAEAVRVIWARDGPGAQVPPDDEVIARIRAFSSRLPADVISGAGGRLRTMSVLLMALDAERDPPFKTTELKSACARVGYPKPQRDADEGAQYEHALRFFDQVIKESAARRLDRPGNRLEAQSVVWGIERDLPEEKTTEVVRGRGRLA